MFHLQLPPSHAADGAARCGRGRAPPRHPARRGRVDLALRGLPGETSSTGRGLLYHCENVTLTYRLAQVDTFSPADMRAPGATTGVFALEIAMDELAAKAGIDPVELRLRNYADEDENENKSFTSKELRGLLPRGRGALRLVAAQGRAALYEAGPRVRWARHGDRRLGSVHDKGLGSRPPHRGREGRGRERGLGYRHRDLHHPEPDRGRRARPRHVRRHGENRRFLAAHLTGRGRVLDRGLERQRRAARLPGCPGGAVQARSGDGRFSARQRLDRPGRVREGPHRVG